MRMIEFTRINPSAYFESKIDVDPNSSMRIHEIVKIITGKKYKMALYEHIDVSFV